MAASSSPIVVGVCAERLLEKYPRGVVRGARAIAEKLAEFPDLQLLALKSAEFVRNDVVFETIDLKDWLRRNPLDSRLPREAVRDATLRSLRMAWFGALISSIWKRRSYLRKALKAVARCTMMYEPLRMAYRSWRGLSNTSPPAHPKQFVPFGNLDAILSFEIFEPIWEWPSELYKTRMIAIYHDSIPLRINEGFGWNPEKFFRAAGRMVQRAHSICCNSQSTRRDLETVFPHARAVTTVTQHGHDIERFSQTTPVDRSWIHRKYSCRGRIITMIGTIEARKNQAGMLHACQHLGGQDPNERLTLMLIGRNNIKHSCKHLEETARQYVDIVETGYVTDEDLPKLLAASDVFVFPSFWEGFGLPVLEAMTAGVPVICSDLASLPEVGDEYVTYCDPYDSLSIASAIRRVLDWAPEERASRIAAAREWAAGFTWERCAQGIHAEIVRLVQAGKSEHSKAPESVALRR